MVMALVGEEESAGVEGDVRLDEEVDCDEALSFTSVKLDPIYNAWMIFLGYPLLLQI
jgi:hypothetical protein